MLLKINGRTNELSRYEAGDSQISGKTRGDEKKFREVALVRIDKKVDKIDENVAVISGTVDR